MRISEIDRRLLVRGFAISAFVVVAHAIFPLIVLPIFSILTLFAFFAAIFLLPLIVPAVVIWGIVRSINYRENASTIESNMSVGDRLLRWCRRLACFSLGAAVPYLGWSLYRSASEPSLLRAHSRLARLLYSENIEEAYALTTDAYRASHSLADFKSHHPPVWTDESAKPRPMTVLYFSLLSAEVYDGSDPGFLGVYSGPAFTYARENGEWRFTGEYEEFFD